MPRSGRDLTLRVLERDKRSWLTVDLQRGFRLQIEALYRLRERLSRVITDLLGGAVL